MKAIDTRCVNALRVFGAEMITKAKSGHPGIVLGAAPIIHTLYTRHIRVNAEDEKWFNRDRFVLSAGHGSTLLYMMLHLSGFKVSLDDLKNFRQKGSLLFYMILTISSLMVRFHWLCLMTQKRNLKHWVGNI